MRVRELVVVLEDWMVLAGTVGTVPTEAHVGTESTYTCNHGRPEILRTLVRTRTCTISLASCSCYLESLSRAAGSGSVSETVLTSMDPWSQLPYQR